jgi:hypothetical protein
MYVSLILVGLRYFTKNVGDTEFICINCVGYNLTFDTGAIFVLLTDKQYVIII